MKRKWPSDLAKVRRDIAKTLTQLAINSELMEAIASLDLYDQRRLFRRRDDLEWELRHLREVEARLVDQAWQTVPEPSPMKVTKA